VSRLDGGAPFDLANPPGGSSVAERMALRVVRRGRLEAIRTCFVSSPCSWACSHKLTEAASEVALIAEST